MGGVHSHLRRPVTRPLRHTPARRAGVHASCVRAEDSTPLLEATGTFDEIDAAHSVLARWRASERAIIDRERSQTERQIRLLDRLTDGVMLAASDGSVIYANVAAASLLGGRNPVGGSFIAAVRDHEASDALSNVCARAPKHGATLKFPGEDRVVEAILARVSCRPARSRRGDAGRDRTGATTDASPGFRRQRFARTPNAVIDGQDPY